MGKYTLLIVLSAILGGSLLTLNMRRTAGLTGQNRAEGQASVLARQIAESGQGVALAAAVSDNGFMTDAAFFASFGTDPRSYNGGFYQADSFRSYNGGRRADIVVSGIYGNANAPTRHVLASSYEFDPMDFPGPIWLDVPYATTGGSPATDIDGDATIAGVDVTLNAHLDRTKYNELGGLLSLATMQTALQTALTGATLQVSNGLKNTAKNALLGPGSLLDDLNVENAEDLYQTIIGVKQPSDRTLSPVTPGTPYTVTTPVAWNGPTTITHVTGPLTVASGGRVDGEGVLAVDGDLVVEVGGQLEWDGLVVVRSDEDAMAVELKGTATINGALVVNQEAAPQFGHMDVTVLRAPTGSWSPPWGVTGPGYSAGIPFYEHTHKFDDLPSAGVASGLRMVRLVNDAGPSLNQDANLIFQQTLDGLGSADVQIRFKNHSKHGHGFYSLQLDGEPVVEGPVRSGFPDGFRQGNRFTTRSFPADELESFTIDIRSLPSLERLFDTEPGCDTPWPICVGKDSQREGSLAVQLVRNGSAIYEAAMYWHINEGDEWNQHLADLAAWEADILANGSFGTKLDLSGASITINIPNIVRLSDRLGFVGNQVTQLGTSVRHISATEYRGQPATPATTTVCHQPGTPTEQTMDLAPGDIATHIGHGDTMGACPATPALPATNCSVPTEMVKICRPPSGSDTSWNDGTEIMCSAVPAFLAANPGALEGTCSDNGM
ncbi:MAG: hypothetical protein Rubg2KO_00440 [Rubricoccaceae bacterium]